MALRRSSRDLPRQIERLLAHPRVRPLGAAAIAVNLATTEAEIRAALASLLEQGLIVQLKDNRFTSARLDSSGTSGAPGSAASREAEAQTRHPQ